MNGKDYFKSYKSFILPNVGDKLSISAKEIFIVKERLLTITDSNRVVLFGELV